MGKEILAPELDMYKKSQWRCQEPRFRLLRELKPDVSRSYEVESTYDCPMIYFNLGLRNSE